MSGLGVKVIRGSLTLLAIRTFQRSLGLLSTIILARVLAPEDFAVVAVAMLVIYFADTIADAGTPQYLAQVSRIDSSVVSTAWTLDIIMKSCASFMIFASLPVISQYWLSNEVLMAIMVLAPTIAIRSFANPQLHVDVRNLDYQNVLFVQSWQKLISFCALILFALIWPSYWAFLFGHYVGAISTVVLSWVRCNLRPSFGVTRLREQWMFSRWIFCRSFLGYLRANIDALLISRIYSGPVFGIYTVTREITLVPANDIIGSLTNPLLSSLSRVREDISAYSTQVCTSLLAIAALISPICVFLYVHSDSIILFLLGDQWGRGSEIMVAMLPMLYSFSLAGLTNNLMLSLGLVKSLFVYDAISLCILVSVILAFKDESLETLILARGLAGLAVTLLVTMWAAGKKNVKCSQILGVLIGPMIISLLCMTLAPNEVSASIGYTIKSAFVFALLYCSVFTLCAYLLRTHSRSWRFHFRLIVKCQRAVLLRFATSS